MNVVVTGGGTIAPIDDVRAIANVSTGRFAAAITESCLERGSRVWHVHAPSAILPLELDLKLEPALDPWPQLERLRHARGRQMRQRERLHLVPLPTGTVAEYAAALHEALAAGPADLAFLAMAVSDYEPIPTPGKIESSAEELVIRCRRTPKVIRSVRDRAPSVYLVGFKLLSGASEDALIAAATAACLENRADLTIANDLQSVRGGRHRVVLVRPKAPPEAIGPCPDLANRVVDRVFELAAEARR